MLARPGLTLHHVGYAVRDLVAAAVYYERTLGYLPASEVIHDPLQTAHVQFLALPGGGTYLELVAPDGPESKLARTVLKRPGLNHLCYMAASLEAAIEHLCAEGMVLFSEPKSAVAFAGRRICWLMGEDSLLIELVECLGEGDVCVPGVGALAYEQRRG